MKGKRFEICLLVLLLVICLHLTGMKTMACECPTVIANVTYPEGWFLTYDSDNPETIAPDSNETINIFGCRPPFTWSVSGNGFDLDWYETEGLFNILIADVTACGAAEITITDSEGASATGYMRCTIGQWTTCCWSSGYNGTEAYVHISPTCRWRFELRHWGYTTFCCDPEFGCPGVITSCPESCVYLPDYFYPSAKSQKSRYQVWQCP